LYFTCIPCIERCYSFSPYVRTTTITITTTTTTTTTGMAKVAKMKLVVQDKLERGSNAPAISMLRQALGQLAKMQVVKLSVFYNFDILY
jgi:hypothetical protein